MVLVDTPLERFRLASDLASKSKEVQVSTFIYSMGDKAEDLSVALRPGSGLFNIICNNSVILTTALQTCSSYSAPTQNLNTENNCTKIKSN